MPRLVLGLHAVRRMPNDVDGRDKPGHDDVEPDRYKTLTFYAGRPPPPPQVGEVQTTPATESDYQIPR